LSNRGTPRSDGVQAVAQLVEHFLPAALEAKKDVYVKVDALPADWESAEVDCHMISRAAEFQCRYTTRVGETEWIEAPDQLDRHFSALRDLLYEPNKGAWYSATFRVNSAGKFSVDFDYERRPAFRLWPSDQAWFDDLAKYPRDPDLIPAWMPRSGS
jgi:hypothetical protein